MKNPEQRESVIDLSPRDWDSGKLRPELRQRLGRGLIIPERLPMKMTEDFRREAREFLANSRLWLRKVKTLSR